MLPRPARRRAYRLTYGPLWALLAFTVFAVAGYFVFALHPRNLARFPDLAPLYGVSFRLFAQVHVVLTGLILGYYLVRRVAWRWLGVFGAVYAASLASELIGTTYGLPFGVYRYTDMLGPQWFGRVPYLIPLGWFGMAIPSYVLAYAALPARRHRWLRMGLGAFILATWDLSLDPAMSYLTSYWTWGEAGIYYGMPLLNLGGWYLTGLVLMGLLHGGGIDRWVDRLSVRWMGWYYGLTLLMPLGMVLAAGLWGGALATGAAVGAWAWFIRHRLRRPDADAVAGEDAARRKGHAPQPPPHSSGDGLPGGVRADVWNYFAENSLSFSFAALGFSPADRRRVSCVYAFCRLTDDLVDEAADEPVEGVEARLDRWLALARAAYDRKGSGIAWLDALMDDSVKAGVPFRLVEDLVAGVRMDLGTVNVPSVEALNRYAYQVASVVGIWLCYLFGVRDAWAHERAAALGRAMQITNILRDVGEDICADRVYLPAHLLRAHGLSRADLEAMAAGDAVTLAYHAVIETLMELAEQYYDHAWEGILVLPPSFGRVVAVASEVYRGIHRDIRRHGYDNFHHRACTSVWEKVWLSLRARWRLLHLQCERRKAGASRPEVQTARAPVRKEFGIWARLTTLLQLSFQGLAILDALTEHHPDHVEIRYLRLLSCYFLPGFLGRGGAVAEDGRVLARLVAAHRRHFPPALYQTMVRFLLETDIPETSQHQALRDSLVRSVASEGATHE